MISADPLVKPAPMLPSETDDRAVRATYVAGKRVYERPEQRFS